MRVKLVKLNEVEAPIHPNNIEEGRVEYGNTDELPEVGKRFTIMDGNSRWFSTSIVQEVLEDGKFRTYNSIYQYTIINKIDRPEFYVDLT